MEFFVKWFEVFRKSTKLRAHYIETGVVAVVLSAVAFISGKGIIEWVGVLGVICTFEYQVLSTYIREHAELRKKRNQSLESDLILKEVQVLYYLKELIWIAYFIFLGAFSALAGTFIFIAFGVWRKHYRKYVPIDDDDVI